MRTAYIYPPRDRFSFFILKSSFPKSSCYSFRQNGPYLGARTISERILVLGHSNWSEKLERLESRATEKPADPSLTTEYSGPLGVKMEKQSKEPVLLEQRQTAFAPLRPSKSKLSLCGQRCSAGISCTRQTVSGRVLNCFPTLLRSDLGRLGLLYQSSILAELDRLRRNSQSKRNHASRSKDTADRSVSRLPAPALHFKTRQKPVAAEGRYESTGSGTN